MRTAASGPASWDGAESSCEKTSNPTCETVRCECLSARKNKRLTTGKGRQPRTQSEDYRMPKNKPPDVVDATALADDSNDHRTREAQDDPHRLACVYLRGSAGRAKFRWALAFWRDEWWLWEGERYRLLTDSEVAAQVTAAIKREFDRLASVRCRLAKDNPKPHVVAKVTRGLVSNVLQALKSLVLIPSGTEQPTWIGAGRDRKRVIALQNGLLDLAALLADRPDALTAHSSDWFSSVCLPYAWDRNASCPQFLGFLQEIFEGDAERVNLLQEWFGLCLVGDTGFQKFLILLGEGANGKTVVLTVLTKVLGEPNVSHVPLELFGLRFQLASTLGKLANIVSEIGDCNRVDEAILKSFVAGEPVHIDRKHRDAIQVPVTARLILATNNLPPFADRSSGLWRRLVILPMRVVIPADRQDRQLTGRLLEELPGIFNWAVEGWRRLLAQKQFTEPKVCRDALDEHRVSTNPARAFLTDEMRFCAGVRTPCRDAYWQYQLWCTEHGFKPMDDRQFGKDVLRLYPRVVRERERGGRQDSRPWIYVGLAWAAQRVAPMAVPVGRVHK